VESLTAHSTRCAMCSRRVTVHYYLLSERGPVPDRKLIRQDPVLLLSILLVDLDTLVVSDLVANQLGELIINVHSYLLGVLEYCNEEES